MPAHSPPLPPSVRSEAKISPPVVVAALATALALLGCPGRGDHPAGAPGASGGERGRGSGAVEVAGGFLSAAAVPALNVRSAAAPPPRIETIDPALVAPAQPENVAGEGVQ